MRQPAVLIALLLFAAACSDDPVTEASGADDDTVELSTSTSSTTPTSSSTSSTSTSSTTTSLPASTTTAPQGICGDLVPVVTAGGTRCLDPDADTAFDVDPSWFTPNDTDALLPPVVIAEWRNVAVYDSDQPFDDRLQPLFTAEGIIYEVRMATDGSVVVEEHWDEEPEEYWPAVTVYRPDGSRDELQGAVRLFDVAVFDGVEAAIVTRLGVGEEGFDELVAMSLDDPEFLVGRFGAASDAEYGVTHFDYASGIGVATAWADLTETVHYVTSEGAAVPLSSPSDDLAYNSAPFVTAAALDPTASRVTWAEGPDWDGPTEEMVPAPWRIESRDLDTGDLVLGWQVSDVVADSSELSVDSIHHTGTHVIVNLMTWVDNSALRLQPFVIDLRFEEPGEWTPDFPGIYSPVPTIG